MLSKDYILGFVEGEGCFSIAIGRNIDRRFKLKSKPNKIKNPYLFSIRPIFRITNCEANRQVLEEIKETLNFGNIYAQTRGDASTQNVTYFYTRNFAECLKARDYFKDLVFRTTKGKDFDLWSKGLELMEQKKHLTKEGILEICQLRDQMNFRKTKNKWTTEEVRKILEEKPIHQTAYFNQNQEKLVHNPNEGAFNLEGWLAPQRGNNKPSRFVAP